MKFIWAQEDSVEINDIDKQHQRYFEICNEIDAMLETGDVKEEDVRKRIEELSDYALYHLTTEEDLFEKYAWPGAKAHTAIHNYYRERMKDYISDISKAGQNVEALAREMSDFAGTWLMEHIKKEDMQYKDFFNEKGIN